MENSTLPPNTMHEVLEPPDGSELLRPKAGDLLRGNPIDLELLRSLRGESLLSVHQLDLPVIIELCKLAAFLEKIEIATCHPLDGKLAVYRSRTGGNEWEALTKGLPQRDCYVNVLRDAMAIDKLDSCGVYFGTTGGQVYASADAGDNWSAVVHDLPAVLSVEVQTLS